MSSSLVPSFVQPTDLTIPVALSVDPTLGSLRLDDRERDLVHRLQSRLFDDVGYLERCDAYYDGVQRLTNLGISLPPELEGLLTAVAWPQLAVDPLHERLDVEGFRFPGSAEADTGMWEVWQHNDLDSEGPMGFLDALIHGRSHLVVGMDDDVDVPLVTVESAKSLVYDWDPRRRRVRAALQSWQDGDDSYATVYLPDQTIELGREVGQTRWDVIGRDVHNSGTCPVYPITNRGRVHDRRGKSEISPVVRRLTDSACREMLRMEVGSEFFSTPQRYVVGASISDFEDADGNVQAAWETYIGRWLLLSNADEDDKPIQVGTFQPADPSAHTRVLDFYVERMAEATGLPLSYFGKAGEQAASADAIRLTTDRLVQRAKRKHRAYESALEGAMRAAMAFRNGELPDLAQMIETIWRKPEIPTPAATTDAIAKQTETGHLTPGSDVALERLGYTPLERAQIARERRAAEEKAARQAALDATLARLDATQPGQPGQPVGARPASSDDATDRPAPRPAA